MPLFSTGFAIVSLRENKATRVSLCVCSLREENVSFGGEIYVYWQSSIYSHESISLRQVKKVQQLTTTMHLLLQCIIEDFKVK